MKNTIIDVEEAGVKYVTLTNGTYSIDGEIVTTSSYNGTKFQVKDINSIKRVTEKSVVAYYICGEEQKTVREYTEDVLKLEAKKKVIVDSYDDSEEWQWDSLEDEFEYRKYKKLWTPVTKVIQEFSEPLQFPVEKRKIETGNSHITSEFANHSDGDLFMYNQLGAKLAILHEVFTELGMTFQNKVDYSQTKSKKIWGNSEHSGIEYVTAFGTYLFTQDKSLQIAHNKRGSLESLLAQYKIDREKLREYIIDKYNCHFGHIDANSFDFKGLLSKLQTTQNLLRTVDVKKSGENTYRATLNSLSGAIKQLEENFKV